MGTDACWVCTDKTSYFDDVSNLYGLHQSNEGATDAGHVTDWNHMFWAANVMLAVHTNNDVYHRAAQVSRA